jgi:orotidine-5'-phosphate decarboxylase
LTGVYKQKLSAASFVRKSRLIVGLDFTLAFAGLSEAEREKERARVEKDAIQMIRDTSDSAIAYKFNRQLVLPLGLYDSISRIIDVIHDLGLTAIMDCKINDVGHTNTRIAEYYFDAGFDALIANPFVGWEGGLDSVFKVAEKKGGGVILLCYMSHPAADEGYGLSIQLDKKGKRQSSMYEIFAHRAIKWGADGVIVGATHPERIKEIKKILRDDIPILSPGIGAQGGSVREAIQSGSSYVIAARSVINSPNPSIAAKELADETQVWESG